jgi:hypothetical protein
VTSSATVAVALITMTSDPFAFKISLIRTMTSLR